MLDLFQLSVYFQLFVRSAGGKVKQVLNDIHWERGKYQWESEVSLGGSEVSLGGREVSLGEREGSSQLLHWHREQGVAAAVAALLPLLTLQERLVVN